MSDEETNEPVGRELAVQVSIAAVDADSVKDATRLRLEIEGDANIIIAFASMNVRALQAMFGDQFTLTDADGQPYAPKRIDPLAGDDSVEE